VKEFSHTRILIRVLIPADAGISDQGISEKGKHNKPAKLCSVLGKIRAE